MTDQPKPAYTNGNYAADAKIKILVKGNPKKKGTASHTRFAKYKSGMTVAKALAAGITRPDLRWDVAHGFISIE